MKFTRGLRPKTIQVGASVSEYPVVGEAPRLPSIAMQAPRLPLILLFFAFIGVHSRFVTPVLAQDAAKPEEKVTFQDHVFPIFEDACLNCHNPDETKGGLDLSTFGATMEGGSGGEIVTGGDPAGSRILLNLLHREEPFMPPKKPMLDNSKLDILTKWIEGGLLDNPNSKPRKKTVADFAMTLTETPIGKPEGPPPMPEKLLLEPVLVAPRPTAVQDLATSPWAPVVALTGQHQVLLYNTDTHRLLGILPFPEGFPQSLTFSRNGSLLLAGGGIDGKSGRAVAWDIRTGKRVIEAGSEFDTVLAADISPDQSRVALGGPGRNIKIFDTATGEPIHNLKKHPDWLLELAYSPDGKFLVSGGRSGGLYLWDAPKGIEFFTLKGHTQAITGITWRDDSKVVATSSEDGQVILWNPADGNQIRKWDQKTPALSIDFDHAGNLVTSGRDNKGRIWDQNGKLLQTLEGFTDIVLDAAFSHDGKRVVATDWTGTVSTWNSADSKRIGTIESNPPAIATRLESLERAHAESQAGLVTARKAYDALARKKSDSLKRQGEITKEIASLTEKRKAQDTAAGEHKSALAGLQKQFDQLEAAVTAKEQALASATASMNEARAQLTSIQTELDQWKKRLESETMPKAPVKAALVDPATIILLADNSKDPKIPAPKPAPKPAAKPTAKPAAPTPPKKIENPEPGIGNPSPNLAPSEVREKIAALTGNLKDAESDMKAAEAAEAAARKALAAETAKRDGMNGQITERKSQQAAAEKSSKDLAAQIAKLDGENKALTPPIAEADKALPAARKTLDEATARANSIPDEINFWTAAFFHVEVVAEAQRLDEMVLNQPESPTLEERSALDRQKMKVAALEQHHASMLKK